MFSICEEPLVMGGNQALAFVWKGDSLWTRSVDIGKGNGCADRRTGNHGLARPNPPHV
jgi:hypothetical protein